MKDYIFKIKILIVRIIRDIEYEYHEWKENVKDRYLDENDCCDGRECGCNGITVRKNLEWELNNKY